MTQLRIHRRDVARALCGVILCLLGSAQATRVELGAVLDGEWRATASAGACTLERHVGGVGNARFERAAGSGERFVLTLAARMPVRVDSSVQATVAAPPWHPTYPRDEHLAALPVPADRRTLSLPTAATTRLRSALADGWLGVFSSDARPAEGWPVPGTTFRDAEQRYLRCVAALPTVRTRATALGRPEHVSPAPVVRTRVPFAEQEIELGTRGRRALDHWLAKSGASGGGRIAIAGFADDAGGFTHNVALSRRRAEAVASYLRGRGVPAERIELRYFGDQYPVGDSFDSRGRASNRRVTVRLR